MDNYLTIIGDSGLRGRHGERILKCLCKCGIACNIQSDRLNSGHTKSCGCLRRNQKSNFIHGHKTSTWKSPEYTSWLCMKYRCSNPKHENYKYYGGRGIKVCAIWEDSFTSFLDDMGLKPTVKHTLDRINPELGYFKDNCRWATSKEQARNKRSKANV